MQNPNARPLNEAGTGVVLTEAQEEFIEWLVDPSRVGSQNQFARDHGVSEATLSKWKKDLSFKEQWDKRLADLNVRPDRIQKIVEAMYDAATGSGPQAVKAMELYLRYVDRFTPKTIVEAPRTAADLTDDELADALENVTLLRQKPPAALPGETKRQTAIRHILAE